MSVVDQKEILTQRHVLRLFEDQLEHVSWSLEGP